MRKVISFSILLIMGLVLSQILPMILGESYGSYKVVQDAFLYICLAFIMINVGREFIINKKEWRSYGKDYVVAMFAAGLPWIFVAFYYIFVVAPELQLWNNGTAWKETFLLSRYAAPTSAGILFTMLAAAGLARSWVYKKVQVLAIFDDLDTILFMIPLQMLMIGMKWQMFVIVVVAVGSLAIGWKYMHQVDMKQSWKHILLYSVIIYALIDIIYRVSYNLYGQDGAIHIEILLPAFVLGMVMKERHTPPTQVKGESRASDTISYLFMLLVGMSMPQFIGVDFTQISSEAVISHIPMLPWGEIAVHVLIVTLISNIGKMAVVFFYKDRMIEERLAVAIGMFTRGEVGAGVLFIAIGYGIGGPLLVISVLTMILNLLLTGIFITIAKRLAAKAERIHALRQTA